MKQEYDNKNLKLSDILLEMWTSLRTTGGCNKSKERITVNDYINKIDRTERKGNKEKRAKRQFN